MKSNQLLIQAIITALFPFSAFAENTKWCSSENKEWNGTRCVTTGTAAVGATASGIYSVKKYKQSSSLEDLHTKRIFDGRGEMGRDPMLIAKATSTIADGDKVTIKYEKSPQENRKHHIELMEKGAEEAKSNSQHYSYQSQYATKTETIYTAVRDAQGNVSMQATGTQTVPDHEARANYARMALEEARKENDYKLKALDARRGGPVPTYDFTKSIDFDAIERTRDYTKERLAAGGTITRIERLPAEKLALVKEAYKKGSLGAVGLAVGVVAVGIEAATGVTAKAIDKSLGNSYSPDVKAYK